MKSDDSKPSEKWGFENLFLTCRCGTEKVLTPAVAYKKALVENSPLFSSMIKERCPDCGNDMLDVYRKKTAEKPSEKQIRDYLMKKYKDMSAIDIMVRVHEENLALLAKLKLKIDDSLNEEMFVFGGFTYAMHRFFKRFNKERAK
jgi:hypothetical protein